MVVQAPTAGWEEGWGVFSRRTQTSKRAFGGQSEVFGRTGQENRIQCRHWGQYW